MAKEMTIVKLDNSEREQFVYESNDSVNQNTTAGESIILPAGIYSGSVTVKIGTGATVKVQACSDKIADINSGSVNNTWIDWDYGNITTDKQDSLPIGASAIRLYCVVAGSTASILKVSAK